MKRLKIKNKIIENIKPLRGDFTNFNGNFSAQGTLLNKKVKIYSPFHKSQIYLRYEISKSSISKYFPKLIVFDEKFIVEEWIKGSTLKEKNYKTKKSKEALRKSLIRIIYELKKFKYSKKIAFDYISHIYKRSERKRDSFFYKLKKIPNCLNHNDLTYDNIIFYKKKYYLIDNEFLGYNNGWILNLRNSFLKEFIEFYENKLGMKDLEKLWNIRKKWEKKFKTRFLKSLSLLSRRLKS